MGHRIRVPPTGRDDVMRNNARAEFRQNMGIFLILGDGYQSMKRDLYTHYKDSHCWMDD